MMYTHFIETENTPHAVRCLIATHTWQYMEQQLLVCVITGVLECDCTYVHVYRNYVACMYVCMHSLLVVCTMINNSLTYDGNLCCVLFSRIGN